MRVDYASRDRSGVVNYCAAEDANLRRCIELLSGSRAEDGRHRPREAESTTKRRPPYCDRQSEKTDRFFSSVVGRGTAHLEPPIMRSPDRCRHFKQTRRDVRTAGKVWHSTAQVVPGISKLANSRRAKSRTLGVQNKATCHIANNNTSKSSRRTYVLQLSVSALAPHTSRRWDRVLRPALRPPRTRDNKAATSSRPASQRSAKVCRSAKCRTMSPKPAFSSKSGPTRNPDCVCLAWPHGWSRHPACAG